MAATTRACPRDRYVPAEAQNFADQNFAETIANTVHVAAGAIAGRLSFGTAVQATATAHLLALAATVLDPSRAPQPIILVVTGLLLVVLSLAKPEASVTTGTEFQDTVAFAPDAGGKAHSHTDPLALERQTQRLAEIADTATRARRDVELRGRVWADLTARISHELRTPLNAVIGFSDIMDAELFGPVGHERYKEYTRHIRDSGRDLLKSTEDTLAMTALLGAPASSATAAPHSLAELIADAWSFFEGEPLARGVSLMLDIEDHLNVVGERRPLRQILINVLTEALVRAPDDSAIVISTVDDAGLVGLEIMVADARFRPHEAQAPLAICIARVLLELQGARLTEETDTSGRWLARTVLERAEQADFFCDGNRYS